MPRCLAQLARDRRVAFHLDRRQIERKLRLFFCACARLRWDALVSDETRRAVAVIERHSDGLAARRHADLAERAGLRAAGGWYSPERWLAANLAGLVAVAAEPQRVLRGDVLSAAWPVTDAERAALLRDLMGDPFDPVVIESRWLTAEVVGVARAVRDGRDFSPMPILADALQDAGCEDERVLEHCRGGGVHARGCWVLDAVLGSE